MHAIMTTVNSAQPKVLFSETTDETNTEPTSAVPSEDPRFEMLRDKPEISPWSFSGKLDCTTLTEDVSMTPTPAPISRRPGMKLRMLEVALAKNNRRIMPTMVITKPTRMRFLWEYLSASLLAIIDVSRMPMVAGVRI